MECWLEILSNVASITTAVVALVVWLKYEWESHNKIKKLENYLKNEEIRKAHTIPHLMAQTGLTESEIFYISCKSHFIKRREKLGEDNQTAKILFEYDSTEKSN